MMQMYTEHARRDGGFTLLELTVVVAIIVALAAVVVPMVGTARRDGEVAEILQVVDSLRTAVHRYHSDCGSLPLEMGDSTNKQKHNLALDPGNVSGWKGPYLDHALTKGDNPFGGTVNVYDRLNSSVHGGFRLMGGAKDATGDGSFVRFTDFPEDMAQLIDEALDKGVSGNWKSRGRVQWKSNRLDIFLLDLDGK